MFHDVESWLTVGMTRSTQSQQDEEKAMKKCFSGFRPDFKSRYQLSKKAETEAGTIAKLLDHNKGFTRVSHRPALEGIDIIRPVKVYEAIGSRSGAFNGVMAALEDDNVNIIGVYGI